MVVSEGEGRLDGPTDSRGSPNTSDRDRRDRGHVCGRVSSSLNLGIQVENIEHMYRVHKDYGVDALFDLRRPTKPPCLGGSLSV